MTAITLEWLIRQWEQFARAVESGYAGYWEEYLNDLLSRDMIEEVMRALPKEDAAKVARHLAEADDTYRRATDDVTDTESLFWRVQPGDGWWMFRAPLKAPTEPFS